MLLDSQHESVPSSDSPRVLAGEPPKMDLLGAKNVLAYGPPRLSGAQLQGRLNRANQVSFWVCALPFIILLIDGWARELGPNPVETIAHTTGIWALRLLWLSLAVSPVRQLTGWQWLTRLRRVPALFCFFYASLHLLTFALFDHEFALIDMAKDVMFRPYLGLGMLSYVLLAPLAITSTDAMIRRMGGKRWRQLHRLTYAAAIAAALHYLLLVKRDILAPGGYIVILALLLLSRMIRMTRRPAR